MYVASIVGARPQFIKMAAVSRAFARFNQRCAEGERLEQLIIHTGQHYDYGMSEVFFEELDIPEPQYNLGVGSVGHGEQTGEMLKRLEAVLLAERPERVLVYGDTNTTLAGALAAAKLHVPVAHVEAGLRSYRKKMPEEINRVLTDHVCDLLFCPTETAVRNLQREGFTNISNSGYLIPVCSDVSPQATNHKLHAAHKPHATGHLPLVLNVGDVMYDSIMYNVELAEKRADAMHHPELEEGYFLATVHRAENTDNPENLAEIFAAFSEIATLGYVIVCPLHPRTKKALEGLRACEWPSNLKLIEPVSYMEMLLLERNAQLILTDSGGVQKEAFILRRPLITLREETEWTETVTAGWNVLTAASRTRILQAVARFDSGKPTESERFPYGDGRAADRIAHVLARGD